MSSVKSGNLTSSFPTCILFISLSSLIAPLELLCGAEQKWRKQAPGPVLDRRGKACSPSPVSAVFAVGLSWWPGVMSSRFLSIPSLLSVFIFKNC